MLCTEGKEQTVYQTIYDSICIICLVYYSGMQSDASEADALPTYPELVCYTAHKIKLHINMILATMFVHLTATGHNVAKASSANSAPFVGNQLRTTSWLSSARRQSFVGNLLIPLSLSSFARILVLRPPGISGVP